MRSGLSDVRWSRTNPWSWVLTGGTTIAPPVDEYAQLLRWTVAAIAEMVSSSTAPSWTCVRRRPDVSGSDSWVS
jgi:hypothetical protein